MRQVVSLFLRHERNNPYLRLARIVDYSSDMTHLEKKALMPQPGDLVQAYGTFNKVLRYDGHGNIVIGNASGNLTIWATRFQPHAGGWWIVK
jgi:hypothetical protein